MSVVLKVAVGPYAEFPVPEGRADEFPPEDEDGELLFEESLVSNWNRYVEPRTDCYRYVPDVDYLPPSSGWPINRPPSRQMLLSSYEFLDQDLTELDRQAEMAWFAATFAEELQALAERFGSPPALRWGVVSFLT